MIFIPLDPASVSPTASKTSISCLGLVTASYDEVPHNRTLFQGTSRVGRHPQAAVAQDRLIMSTNDRSGFVLQRPPRDGRRASIDAGCLREKRPRPTPKSMKYDSHHRNQQAVVGELSKPTGGSTGVSRDAQPPDIDP